MTKIVWLDDKTKADYALIIFLLYTDFYVRNFMYTERVFEMIESIQALKTGD